MNSREKILGAVKANKPEYLPLSTWTWDNQSANLVETFTNTLTGIGGTVKIIKDISSIKENLQHIHDNQKRIVNTLASLNWNNSNDKLVLETASELETIEVAILEGHVGVAENGAIWIDEASMGHRALPFICQHLIIVLPIKKLVANMHQAYASINVARNGFGCFIAGPSKTADIEQALVIGAHGARSLVVYLLDE